MLISNKENYDLWDDFLKQWPKSRIETMTLEEYTNAGSKETFTYWMESGLDQMGSIWGGSSFKFGIYNRNDTSARQSTKKSQYSDDYGWMSKYGDSPEDAFEAVRAEILKVISAVQAGDLKQIDGVDLGHSYKWKIAFHYQDRNKPLVLPVYKLEMLLTMIKSPIKIPTSEIYKTLMTTREDKDLIEYGRELWTDYAGLAKIWKLSHGKDDFTAQDRKDFIDRLCVTVHKDTKKGQGNGFADEMNPGDYFYLCHGNDEGIVLFGRITSEATTGSKGDGWLERSYEIIKKPEKPRRYNGVNKGWAPNNNSTVKKVKPNEIGLFEEQILLPFFDMKLSDLESTVISDINSGGEVAKAEDVEVGSFSLNTIYYGPPGTGKTYKLLNEFANKLFVDKSVPQSESERAMLLVESNDLSWWQAAALSYLDLNKPAKVTEIREHPIMKAKIMTSSSKQPSAAIWAHLQIHAKRDCPNVNYSANANPFIFWKDEKSTWSIDRDEVESTAPELLELLSSYQNKEKEPDAARYVFTTFHQSFSYEDFVEGIKPVMDTSVESDLSYRIEPGIFKRISIRAAANPDKKYAIFIDEINRGNVASIFGELITLIEPDKRSGAKNEVIVNLPYSKESFSVPPNLYIIGTMNTADRSIVALDSALRRRFKFEECFPEPGLISQPDDLNVDLRELLKVINKRITMVLDRDHCIGHSYFMDIASATKSLDALRDVFSRNVIPLLEEYFSGDLARVGMILGDRFVQQSDGSDGNIELASGPWDTGMDTKEVFELTDISDLTEEDFASIYENS